MKAPIKDSRLNARFCYLVLLTLLIVVTSFLNLKLIPIDGLFQTYNSTRRLNLGEVPYKDFLPYLGLGPVVVNFLGANLLGGTLVSQFMFLNALHILLGVFIIYVCFVVFLSLETREKFFFPIVIATTGIYLLGLHWPYKSVFFILAEYTRPGNSAIGLRACILFLMVFAALRIEKGKLIFLGYLLLGLSLIWSVDYAFITFITGSVLFRYPEGGKFWKILQNTAANIIVGGLVAVVLVLSLTQNNLKNWFDSNYIIQRDFQYWYFGVDENFFYGISYLPYMMAIVLSTLLAVVYLTLGISKENLARFFIIISTTFVGLASQINSAPSPRYLVFSLMVNIFGFLGLWKNFKSGGLDLKVIRIKFSLHLNKKLTNRLTRDLPALKTIRKYQKVLSVIAMILILLLNYFISQSYVSTNQFVPKLGGFVDKRLVDSALVGESLSDSKGTNLLTTYMGVTSLVAGKLNPTKTDYIIHAFTDKERRNWLNALEDPSTNTVITTRSDVLDWEPWIVRANWWFYSELMSRFQVVKIGAYEIYWNRKTRETNKIGVEDFKCSVIPIDKAQTFVSILSSDINLVEDNAELVVSVELNYSSKNMGPKGMSRNRITITPLNELVNLDPENANSFLNVGAPKQAHNYQTYVKFTKYSSNQLLLKSSPTLASELKVSTCQIKDVFQYSALFPDLPSSDMSFNNIVKNFKR